MALTPVGAALTEAYSLAQGGIVSGALRRVLTLWGVLDITNLDASFAEYLTLTEPVISEAKHNSARAASGYYDMMRAAERVPGISPAGKFLADLVASGEMEMTLGPIGPAYIRKAITGGMTFEQAAAAAWVKQSGAMSHSVLAGGRDTIARKMQEDPGALGYQRHASSDCCAYCGLMASKGIVFKSKRAAFISAKSGKAYHLLCRCTPEPVFHRNSALSPSGKRFDDLYKKHKDLNEIRRELDGRSTKADEENTSGGESDG